MDVLLGSKTKIKYYPGTKKPFEEKSEMTISDVWMPLAVPEKREQDVAINLILGVPTEGMSEWQKKGELQAEVSSQTNLEVCVIITRTIDGMISNNPSDKIVTENKIFNSLEEANPEIATDEGAYVWSKGL